MTVKSTETYKVKVDEVDSVSKGVYNIKFSYLDENVPKTVSDFYNKGQFKIEGEGNGDVLRSGFSEGDHYKVRFNIRNYENGKGRVSTSTRTLDCLLDEENNPIAKYTSGNTE